MNSSNLIFKISVKNKKYVDKYSIQKFLAIIIIESIEAVVHRRSSK